MWGGEGDEKSHGLFTETLLQKCFPDRKQKSKYSPVNSVTCIYIPNLYHSCQYLFFVPLFLLHRTFLLNLSGSQHIKMWWSITVLSQPWFTNPAHKTNCTIKIQGNSERKRKRCLCLRNYYLMGKSGWMLKQFSILLLGVFFLVV